MIKINHNLTIPDSELEERFIRASGPGGQNVNKVSTAVELRFNVAGSAMLMDSVRARLVKLAGSRMTLDGVLIIQADSHRTQLMNRSDAAERLASLIKKALIAPKRRIATKPGKAAKERRLVSKGVRADVKRGRKRPIGDL